MKNLFRKRFSLVETVGLIAAGSILVAVAGYAAGLYDTLKQFQPNTPAISGDVNINFQTLAGEIDNLKAQVATLSSGTKSCPDDMVAVGPICVDKYEASISDSKIGGNPITDLTQACSSAGVDCFNKIFAHSVPGVVPTEMISWFQAQLACANSGKRLLTNAEWQMAATGTPDPGDNDNLTTTCVTKTPKVAPTGSRSGCVSKWGVYDMIGNRSEWVADWIQGPGYGDLWNPGKYVFSATQNHDLVTGINEAAPSDYGMPAALVRGGYNGQGADAGEFALDATRNPLFVQLSVGFRCAK